MKKGLIILQKMKIRYSILFMSCLAGLILYSCSKKNEESDLNLASSANVTVTTLPVEQITYHSALLGLQWKNNNNNLPVASFGFFLGSSQVPIFELGYSHNGSTRQFINFDIFAPGTSYNIRAFVKVLIPQPNAFPSSPVQYDTVFGPNVKFTTLQFENNILFNPGLTYGSLSDIDGNIYRTIQIGTQVWMAENLKVSKYSDGSSIQNIEDMDIWQNDTVGAYCLYQNDNNYGAAFGNLYNYYAVVSTHDLCPTGWHVPDYSEWETLINYLGGDSIAGSRLKETGTTHWEDPNKNATDESGFTALPGGCLSPLYTTYFIGTGTRGTWWSSSKDCAFYKNYFYPIISSIDTSNCYCGDDCEYFNNGSFNNGRTSFTNGRSVRCIKDN